MKKTLLMLVAVMIGFSSYAQKLNREYVSGNPVVVDANASGPGNQPIGGASIPSTGLMVALMSLGACAIVGIKQRKVA